MLPQGRLSKPEAQMQMFDFTLSNIICSYAAALFAVYAVVHKYSRPVAKCDL